MANRWKGNFLIAAAITSSGTLYTGRADGSWSLNSQLQQTKANLWASGLTLPSGLSTPTALAGDSTATVSFSLGATGGQATAFTVTSSPDNLTATGNSSPITLTGLTNGTYYTFTVTATNPSGSVVSSSSNSVVPAGSFVISNTNTNLYSRAVLASSLSTSVSAVYDIGNSVSASLSGNNAYCFVSVEYKLTAFNMSAAGTFGTQYSFTTADSGWYNQPAQPPVVLDSSYRIIALDVTNPPYYRVFNFSSGYSTKYANPASMLASGYIGQSLDVKPNAPVAISFAYVKPAYSVKLQSISSGVGGTIQSDASALSMGEVIRVRYANDTTAPFDLYMTNTNGEVYLGSVSTGWVATPSLVVTAANATSSSGVIAFSPDSTKVILGKSVYSRSKGTLGSKISNPATPLVAGDVASACFNATGTVIIFGGYNATINNSPPYLESYAWSSSGFGTKFSNIGAPIDSSMPRTLTPSYKFS